MAFITGIQPGRIRPLLYILPRERSLQRLIVYFVTGFFVSILTGGFIVVLIGRVSTGDGFTLSPILKIVLGVVCLLFALLLWAGVIETVHAKYRVKKPKKTEQPFSIERIPGFQKLPHKTQYALLNDSTIIACSLGISAGLPGVYYLAAIAAVLSSQLALWEEVSALVFFNLIAFFIVEAVIIAVILKPSTVHRRLTQVHAWVINNNRNIITVLSVCIGLYFILGGIAASCIL